MTALLLTLGNLGAGFTAIALLTVPQLAGWGSPGGSAAVWLIVLAALFDAIDGPVARRRGTRAIGWGRELDALADLVSFGIAPAVLWGVSFPLGSRVAVAAGGGLFVLAAAWRLARFLTQEPARGSFTGMPITAAGLALTAFWLFESATRGDVVHTLPGLALMMTCSLLMVSRIVYDKFPEFGLNDRRNNMKWGIAAGAVLAIAANPPVAGLGVALLYAAHGPIRAGYRLLRAGDEQHEEGAVADRPEGSR